MSGRYNGLRRRFLRLALDSNTNEELYAISFSSVTQEKVRGWDEKYLFLRKGQTSGLVQCRIAIRPGQLPKSQ